MSDTPRTDAEGVRFARLMIEWPKPGQSRVTELVPADFARDLERQLAQLEKDAARYRWLRDFIAGIHTEPGARGTGLRTWTLQIVEPIPVMTAGDLMGGEVDEAIDEAMKEPK